MFDSEDLGTFVEEMGNAILAAIGTGAGDDLRTLGRDWEVTAEAIADSHSREMLLGRHKADDFIEVARPV